METAAVQFIRWHQQTAVARSATTRQRRHHHLEHSVLVSAVRPGHQQVCQILVLHRRRRMTRSLPSVAQWRLDRPGWSWSILTVVPLQWSTQCQCSAVPDFSSTTASIDIGQRLRYGFFILSSSHFIHAATNTSLYSLCRRPLRTRQRVNCRNYVISND